MAHIGLQIPSFTIPGTPDEEIFENVAAAAVAAEASGFDSVWVMDHFYQLDMLGGPDLAMLEGYTLLGAIAARTQRVQLGTLVTGVTYRNPALVAKQVTTLDLISRGRAILGIGAAWYELEHRGYGFAFPPIGERLDRLEEAVQICRAMFTQERPSFEGLHYRIEDARNLPRPVRPGGPPILIGGGGERRTLRLVARYADMCNVFGGVETLKHKLGVLARHCDEVGRDPARILKTRLGTLCMAETSAEAERLTRELEARVGPAALRDTFTVGDPDAVCEQVQALLDTGLDGVIFNMPAAHDPAAVRLAGETLSRNFG